MQVNWEKEGVVEYYDKTRNFGFVAVTNSDNSVIKYFIHGSQVLFTTPQVGSIVRFCVGQVPVGRTLDLALRVFVVEPVTAEKSEAGVK